MTNIHTQMPNRIAEPNCQIAELSNRIRFAKLNCQNELPNCQIEFVLQNELPNRIAEPNCQTELPICQIEFVLPN
jgi:hypothetical protein